MTSPAPPRRRWFRFSLRDLFWLVLVCAVLLGWWVDRKVLGRYFRDRVEAERQFIKEGFQRDFDSKRDLYEMQIKSWENKAELLSRESQKIAEELDQLRSSQSEPKRGSN